VQAAWACLTVSLLLCVQETPARRRRQHHQDQDQDQDQDQEWDIQQEQEDQEQYKASSHSEWYFPWQYLSPIVAYKYSVLIKIDDISKFVLVTAILSYTRSKLR
jgi:hypothetical protein